MNPCWVSRDKHWRNRLVRCREQNMLIFVFDLHFFGAGIVVTFTPAFGLS